ncbi:PepSY domain-containing protein [Rhodoplanes elegans]|nr:hypothetical protein [Rhodoplanes elegans]
MRTRAPMVAVVTAVLSAGLVAWSLPCIASDPEPGSFEPRAAEPRGPEPAAAETKPAARPHGLVVPTRTEGAAVGNGNGAVTGATAATAPAGAAAAPAGPRCLTRAEQRARTAAKQVVPLAKAASAVKARHGELLRARLCEQNGRLVYMLTVLPRGGKVVRATVDAGTGALISGP